MQTTLLGLALALIAAILAAFAAPLFIDWNGWRPQLEAQASALAGTRVTISGNIELTLLPTPAFVLRDVSLGDAEKGTGMRASEMRGSLALTALLSGKVEASEFVISRPAIRLVIEKDGTLLLPSGATGGQEISVSSFVFEAGSLTVEDRRTNSLLMADDFSARGELVAREGPFRLDGGFRLNGARWILKVGGSRFGPDHAGKIRLSLESPADRVVFDAEGSLALANTAPRFDGKLTLSQQSGALPWRVSADAAGDAAEMRLANLELALGKGELPITLSGEAKLTPRANGAIEATLASKRIDLDLGDPKAGAAGAAYVLPRLVEARELLAALPLSARLTLSADGVLAGGQLIRDLHAGLRTQDGAVLLERFEARLPGRSTVNLSGKHDGERFNGPLSFVAEEPQIFARWLLGEELSGKIQMPSALQFNATLGIKPDEVVIGDIRALVERVKIGGRLLIQPWREPQSYVVQADLETQGADFDAILPLVAAAADTLRQQKFTLNLYATGSRLLNRPLPRASLALTNLADGFQIKNLSLDDFDGVSAVVKYASGAQGTLEFSGEATKASGLAAVLEYLSGSADFAQIAAKYAAARFPIKIEGTATPAKNGWRTSIKSGAATLALDLGELRDARRPVEAVLQLPDTEISAKGEFHVSKDGRFEPAFALALKSSDLRNAFALAARASETALPASGNATLVRDGNNLVLDKIGLELAGARGQGRISFPLGAVSPFSGVFSLDKANAAPLFSLVFGPPNQVGTFSDLAGSLRMEIASLDLNERVSLQKAAFNLRLTGSEALFEEFRAGLAGGKVSGVLRIADSSPRLVDLKADFSEVAFTQLFGTGAVRGTVRGNLALSASGDTQEALFSSVAGQGTIAVLNLELERTDATAVAYVFGMAAREAPDETKAEQTLIAALERAPLKVSKLEAPLVIANGIFRSGTARAVAGNTEITLSGALDLPKRSVDALLNIEVTGNSAVRPGAAIRWQGPLGSPERKVDARALITAITLRAIERAPANLPPEERKPVSKKKRNPSNTETDSAPPLPPVQNVAPASQPRSQN
ncbi:MAG: AsmA family protein [Xanthobacteraceae bacterium]|nr:AsmA family protein [Xanthobacteraceae bacterium]MCW5675521.1 AsmA family protein [Xanthobacteraceae bacterium]